MSTKYVDKWFYFMFNINNENRRLRTTMNYEEISYFIFKYKIKMPS